MSTLALQRIAGSVRRATNLLPAPRGLVSRPGAVQIISGVVTAAVPFGTTLLFARDRRLWVYDHTEQDLGPVPNTEVTGTAYQALLQFAQREPRLYLAMGGGPPCYVTTDHGRHAITNHITADTGAPYPVPTARVVAAWRGRLWVSDGDNRLHHCELDAPDAWDPLYTLEFQTGRADGIRAVLPHENVLFVALADSLWSVSGDSQFNWRRDMLVDGRGVQSATAVASDGERLFYIARRGLYQLGEALPLAGEALAPLFDVADPGCSLLLDESGLYLYALLHGRLLVLNTTDWRVGEIVVPAGRVHGLCRWKGQVGWYGDAGVWLQGAVDHADCASDGTDTQVWSVMESWDDMPNPGGRAVLARCLLEVGGSPRGPLFYEVDVDGFTRVQRVLSAAPPEGPLQVLRAWDGTLERWPDVPVRHDLSLHVAGLRFVQRIRSAARLELYRVDPRYQYGEDKEDR